MKKPGLALVISAGGDKSKNDDEATAMGESDDYAMAVDELADVLGVPEGKRADFAESLKAVVAACK